jgi:hypothetical protein
MGMENLDHAKVGLEMTLVSFFFVAFPHAFSNAI